MLITDATRLPRIMECNGSRNMPASFPIVDDPAARDEGIAAHYMVQAVFSGAHDIEELVDRKAPNGFFMSIEMSEYVTPFLELILGPSFTGGEKGEIETETTWGTEAFNIGGRADHIKYNRTSDCLYIDDLKYGWSLVEPERNWTLLSHAIGYCISCRITPSRIYLRIHQPRPYHPDGKTRTWMITYAQLMEYYREITATLTNPSDMLRSGLAWCRRCHALASCPAARAANMNAIDATTDATYSDDVSNELLAFELDTLRTASATLENRLNALEEMTKHRLKAGAVIPNYGVETQYGHTRWKAGYDASMVNILTGKDLTKPGLVTPAEAKRRGVPEAVITTMTERPMTGIKLIRASADKRAAKIFGSK